MIAKLVLPILMFFLSGCAISQGLLGLLGEQPDTEQLGLSEEDSSIEVFQDLLKQGWKIQIYKEKVLLIKETPDGFIINDVFSVLKER